MRFFGGGWGGGGSLARSSAARWLSGDASAGLVTSRSSNTVFLPWINGLKARDKDKEGSCLGYGVSTENLLHRIGQDFPDEIKNAWERGSLGLTPRRLQIQTMVFHAITAHWRPL